VWEEIAMRYCCRYEWHADITRQRVAQRFTQQHEAGRHHVEKWRGWYALGGGGAGFMLVETDDPRELTEMFQPSMDLMSWDVRAIYELSYDEMAATMREVAQQGSSTRPAH
jgi:hypothetical protein